ncbi:MAG: maleylacetoacetate isomerase [Polyangiaceae bacterium]
MNLKLYSYWRSSSAYRVRAALHHKELPFEYAPVNLLAAEHRTPEYLARSPLGHVPCLEVDGTPYVESVAIIELLDELFGERPLLPTSAEGRAHVRALVEVVNSGTQPVQNLVVLQRLPEGERAGWAKHFIARGLEAYEGLLESFTRRGLRADGYSYGEALSMADLYLIPQLYNAARFQVPLAPFPHVARVLATAEKLPAFVKAAPEVQPDAPAGAVPPKNC